MTPWCIRCPCGNAPPSTPTSTTSPAASTGFAARADWAYITPASRSTTPSICTSASRAMRAAWGTSSPGLPPTSSRSSCCSATPTSRTTRSRTRSWSPCIWPSRRSPQLGNRYDLLQYNCNHFARRLAGMLQAARPIPEEVFRITDCLNSCRCLIPECILNGRLDWFSLGEGDSYEEVRESVHASSIAHK